MAEQSIPDYILDIRREDAKMSFHTERDYLGVTMAIEQWPSCKGNTRVAIYRPVGLNGDIPCFFFIHGGGWTTRNLEFLDDFCRLCVQNCGICVISPDYMLAPESGYPDMPQECIDCIVYARIHSHELRIDTKKMAIGGDSAGANLSAGICVRLSEEDKDWFKAQLLYYGAFDLTGNLIDAKGQKLVKGIIDGNDKVFRPAEFGLFCRKAYINGADPFDPHISPVCASTKVLEKVPRAFIAVGEKDSMLAHSQAFAKRLAESGVEVTYKQYKNGVHAILSRKTEGYADLLKATYNYLLSCLFVK